MSHTQLPSRLRAAGVATLAAVIVFAVSACNGPPPSTEAFYALPSSISGASGNIIRSRPSVFTTDAVAQTPAAGVKSTQVLYNSKNANGLPIAVSGTVLVPTAPWSGAGSRPLITFAPGTRGLGQDCAPSYTLSQGTDYESSSISAALAKGYAVGVTDYPGMGTPGPHTYMVGQSLGHSVLDMALAAQRLTGSGLSASS